QRNGESILRVRTTDQSVLYGVLARLRDLGVSLISLRTIKSEESKRWYRRWRLGQILSYVLVSGGIIGVIVFLATEEILHVALALTLLFIAMGALAFRMTTLDNGIGWRILTAFNGLAAIITTIVFVAVIGWVHPALVGAIVAFGAAGLLALWMRRWPVRPFVDEERPSEGR
ncbi:MAG: hypothetical protein GYB68_13370, partial [Chloroflexi bacterium]|nr:hypothetical protein [Chloroflexota bacterium]